MCIISDNGRIMRVHMRFLLQLCIVLGAVPLGVTAAAALLGICHYSGICMLLHVLSAKSAHLFKTKK